MEEKRLSDANIITRNYLDSILVEERLIDSVQMRCQSEGRSCRVWRRKVRQVQNSTLKR